VYFSKAQIRKVLSWIKKIAFDANNLLKFVDGTFPQFQKNFNFGSPSSTVKPQGSKMSCFSIPLEQHYIINIKINFLFNKNRFKLF
jgi:hypothetical protein